MAKCGFDQPWVGECKEDCIHDEQGVELGGCKSHWDIKCSCGKPAKTLCDMQMGGLMCGSPICSDPMCVLKHQFAAHYIEHGWATNINSPEDREFVIKHCVERLQSSKKHYNLTDEQIVEVLVHTRTAKTRRPEFYIKRRPKIKEEHLAEWDEKIKLAQNTLESQLLVLNEIDKQMGVDSSKEL